MVIHSATHRGATCDSNRQAPSHHQEPQRPCSHPGFIASTISSSQHILFFIVIPSTIIIDIIISMVMAGPRCKLVE
eukprot:6549552-Karenia_brevis.AAC.1